MDSYDYDFDCEDNPKEDTPTQSTHPVDTSHHDLHNFYGDGSGETKSPTPATMPHWLHASPSPVPSNQSHARKPTLNQHDDVQASSRPQPHASKLQMYGVGGSQTDLAFLPDDRKAGKAKAGRVDRQKSTLDGNSVVGSFGQQGGSVRRISGKQIGAVASYHPYHN